VLRGICRGRHGDAVRVPKGVGDAAGRTGTRDRSATAATVGRRSPRRSANHLLYHLRPARTARSLVSGAAAVGWSGLPASAAHRAPSHLGVAPAALSLYALLRLRSAAVSGADRVRADLSDNAGHRAE